MNILIIDNYDSFTFNLYQMVASIVRGQKTSSVRVVRNDSISISDVISLDPTHIIISPGPGNPYEESDLGVSKKVISNLDQLHRTRILGVCLGHQALVAGLGGAVVKAPEPRHGKVSRVTHNSSSILFKGLDRSFDVMRYHSLVAARERFPDVLEVTAETEDGLVMACQHKTAPVFGVQFHPESTGTPLGRKMMENFL